MNKITSYLMFGKHRDHLTKQETLELLKAQKQKRMALDREKKRLKYVRNPEKQKARSANHYEKNREYYITKSIKNKDANDSQRVIRRMLKHIESQPDPTRAISDTVNEAIELCITAFNKSLAGKDS